MTPSTPVDTRPSPQPRAAARNGHRPSPIPPGFAGPVSAFPDAVRMPPWWVVAVAVAMILGGVFMPPTVPMMGRVCMAGVGASLLVNFVPATAVAGAIPLLVVVVFVVWNPAAGVIMLLALAGYAASRALAVAARRRRADALLLGAAMAAVWGVFGAVVIVAWALGLDPHPGAVAEGARVVAGRAARAALGGGLAGFVAGLLVATVNRSPRDASARPASPRPAAAPAGAPSGGPTTPATC